MAAKLMPSAVASAHLIEGGVISRVANRSGLAHLHAEIDDDVLLFGLGMPIRRLADEELAHAFEHMVMKSRLDENDLVHVLETGSAPRWWQAITTKRTLSFEVSEYTLDALKTSACRLCDAVFEIEFNLDEFEREVSGADSRISVEADGHQSERHILFERLHNAFNSAMQGPPGRGVSLAELNDWRRANVSRADALWFTYGPISLHEAANFVGELQDGSRT